MGYFVDRLQRPYDYRVLIQAYIYTQRKDFIDPVFSQYYASLVAALEGQFRIRLSHEGVGHPQRIFWMHFQSTVRSLLQITSPWADYLEDTLLHRKLEQNGELGEIVYRTSKVIEEANTASRAAHHEALDGLFRAMFGTPNRVVTSEELLAGGFDDSKEPNTSDYCDNL